MQIYAQGELSSAKLYRITWCIRKEHFMMIGSTNQDIPIRLFDGYGVNLHALTVSLQTKKELYFNNVQR